MEKSKSKKIKVELKTDTSDKDENHYYSTNKVPKEICIAGHSGSGKTTMSYLMEKYLPNAYNIRKIEDEFFKIKNREKLEKVYGVPVPEYIDNEKDYLREVAKPYPNREEKFFELLGTLATKNMEAAISHVIETYNPDFIITEGIAMPKSHFWREADYRILVEPANWELLVEFVKRRREKQPMVDEKLAEERCLAVQETLDNAKNVSYRVINNYDDTFEDTIRAICNEIIEYVN